MSRWSASFAASVLIAAVAGAGPPMPVESEWLVTESGMFRIDGDPKRRDGSLYYELEFRLRKPVTGTLHVTVDFENPSDPETPFFAEFEVAPGATNFGASSEKFQGIRNGRKYRVKVWIYADVKRKTLLGTHEQLVLFNLPRELMERFGIESL